MNTVGRRKSVLFLPGMAICVAIALVSILLAGAIPAVSPLLIAIVLGSIVANVRALPTGFNPGIRFASKHLLRAGIILLGLQISIGQLLSLGVETLMLVLVVVTVGVLSTLVAGRLLGIEFRQTALIACGFSICGAAAVAGAQDVVEADEDETATALALVVIFGTVMIPVIPAASSALGMEPIPAGTWAGACIHEVAQVVAAGAVIGNSSLAIAVVVKLARVVCLAFVLAGLSAALRRSSATGTSTPWIPGFILGFLAMVALASLMDLPTWFLALANTLQKLALTTAMAALGLGVIVRNLVAVGYKPVVLALIATVIVTSVSLVGIYVIF